MKLDANRIRASNDRRERRVLVRGKCQHRRFIVGLTDVGVGEVRCLQLDGLRKVLDGAPLDVVPSHVRYGRRAQPGDVAGDEADALSRTLFAGVEKKLHAQANAEAW